jgi:hypothetical protein
VGRQFFVAEGLKVTDNTHNVSDGYYMLRGANQYDVPTLVADYASADDWYLNLENKLVHSSDGTFPYAGQSYLANIVLFTQSDLDSGWISGGAIFTCSFAADVLSCSNGGRNDQFLVQKRENQLFFGTATHANDSHELVGFKRICSPPP